jgi:hypothetical protein
MYIPALRTSQPTVSESKPHKNADGRVEVRFGKMGKPKLVADVAL